MRSIGTIANQNPSSGGTPPVSSVASNQMFSLTKGVDAFTGNVITLNNGISTQSFGFVNGTLDPSADSFIASSNTNKVTHWIDQNDITNVMEFNVPAQAPSLEKDTNGYYYLDFPDGGGSSNGVELTGDLLNIVGMMTKTSFILIRQPNVTSRYIGVGRAQTYVTTASSGTPTLWNKNTQIVDDRAALRSAIYNNLTAINYRDITLYDTATYGLGKYGDAPPGGLWAIKGRIQEISTMSTSQQQTQQQQEQQMSLFITESMSRNNIT